MEYRVLFCGGREWDDQVAVRTALMSTLSQLPAGGTLVIIHGGARGADSMAGSIANEMGIEVKVFKAEWDKYHKAAGPIRNRQMLDASPCTVVYFHKDIRRSRGTADMIRQARKARVPVLNGMSLAIGIGIITWEDV